MNINLAKKFFLDGLEAFATRKYLEAEMLFNKSLDFAPGRLSTLINLSATLIKLKRFTEAENLALTVIQHDQFSSLAWLNLGLARYEKGKLKESLIAYDESIKINNLDAEAWVNKGITLDDLMHYEEAIASFDKAIEIRPEFAEAWSNRASTLGLICRIRPALASFREAIRLSPDDLIAHSSFLFHQNYLESLSPAYALSEAKLYGKKVSEKSIPKFTKWIVASTPKKLRIGFVSGDLSNHPVGYFLEGLLENIDSSKFELYSFPTRSFEDDLTKRIQPFFKEWSPLFGISDLDAATLINQKGVHILIDLSGHTAHNRLPVFSYKPAPIQVSWLGYFATTGIPEIDYFLGDPNMSPASEGNNFTETLWNLSETWLSSKPPNFEIQVSALPAKKNGFVTFGSFGNLSKMNEVVVKTWSSVLDQVPKSKLFLKSKQFGDFEQIELVMKRFEKFNIYSDRLIIEGPDSRLTYYETYNKVDLIFDTFPYPGGTTSMDALWMGVPVLTLKGDRFLSRLGESIAINSGNPDWIAQGIDDYVNKAVKFATDLELLGQLRSNLRKRVLNSPLFDTSRFAKNFEDALWDMWLNHPQKTHD